MEGPYFTPKAAGEYCGYSAKTFRRLAREYRLPRYGPGHARFSASDLDRWMQNPFEFIQPKQSRSCKDFRRITL